MNLENLNNAARQVLMNEPSKLSESTDLEEASATVAMVIKALKLKGGKDADALINKMRDLGLESKVSKAHAEAAKKILKGQIAKFVKNESTDLTEAKKITASTIAKLFKNTKEWGDDLKNQIRVVKGHLEIVDAFYFSSTDAVKRMISAWTTPNGSYAQYFKSEYGVTFKLVDKFTLISATGRYKKVSDDGIAGIILSVHSDALKESEEREELEEATMSQGVKTAATQIYSLGKSLKVGSNLNKGVNKSLEGKYDADFKKMQKAIGDIINVWEEIEREFSDMNESTDLETSNTLTKDEYDEVQNFKSFNEKDWKWVASKKQFIRKTPVKS